MGSRTRQAGAASLEYAGLVLVAALLVGLVMVGTGGGSAADRVGSALCRAINMILQKSGGCSAVPAASVQPTYKPPQCKVSESTTRIGGSIKIIYFKIGTDQSYKQTTYSDGSVKLTNMTGLTAGVEQGFGADVHVGEVVNAGAQVKVSDDLSVNTGSSWVFKGGSPEENQKAADGFAEQIRSYNARKQRALVVSARGAGFGSARMPDPLRAPDETVTEVVNSAQVTGDLGWHAPTGFGKDSSAKLPVAGITAKDQADTKWVKTTNDTAKTVSYTTDLKYAGTINATLASHSGGGQGVLGGSLQITMKDGILTKVTLVHTTDLSLKLKPGQDLKVSKPDETYRKSGAFFTHDDSHMTVVTESLSLDPADPGYAAKLTTVQSWVNGQSIGGQNVYDPLTIASTAFLDLSQPSQGNDFEKLLQNDGQVSYVDYTTQKDGFDLSAEVKLDMVLGGSLSYSDEQTKATGATYLGAPDPEGYRPFTDLPECVAK